MSLKAVLPAAARKHLAERLPADVEVVWAKDRETATAAVADAEIVWVDVIPLALGKVIPQAPKLKWAFTLGAGVENLGLDQLASRGIKLTNGSGVTTTAVAEYAVLGMLAAAKRYDEVVRMADRREWAHQPPGSVELEGSRALIVGMGAIGKAIAQRLAGFEVEVVGVTRSGRDGTLRPDAWRARLGEFDWVLLAAPMTDDTRAMIGATELAAMKPTAWLLNVGRGDIVDQAALIEALQAKRIGGAFLDVVSPEPLPADDPLWSAPNVLQSMHLSGRSQTSMMAKASQLFLENLMAFREGRPMANEVDLSAGY